MGSYDPGPTIPPMDLDSDLGEAEFKAFLAASGDHNLLEEAGRNLRPTLIGVDTTKEELLQIIETQRKIIQELRNPLFNFRPGQAGFGWNYNQRLPLIP